MPRRNDSSTEEVGQFRRRLDQSSRPFLGQRGLYTSHAVLLSHLLIICCSQCKGELLIGLCYLPTSKRVTISVVRAALNHMSHISSQTSLCEQPLKPDGLSYNHFL